MHLDYYFRMLGETSMSDFLKSWLIFKNFLYVKRTPTNSMGGV